MPVKKGQFVLEGNIFKNPNLMKDAHMKSIETFIVDGETVKEFLIN